MLFKKLFGVILNLKYNCKKFFYLERMIKMRDERAKLEVVGNEVITVVKNLEWVLNRVHTGVKSSDGSEGFRFRYQSSDLKKLVDSFVTEGVVKPLTFVCGMVDDDLMLIDGLGRF